MRSASRTATPATSISHGPMRQPSMAGRYVSPFSGPLTGFRGNRPPIQDPRKKKKSNTPQCQNCTNGDVHEDDGQLICRSCGSIVEESRITQELTFGEASNGAAVVQGTYVGAEETTARLPMAGNPRWNGMSSRQISERNALGEMTQIATRLRLNQIDKDRGMQVYKLAMACNMIQGRTVREVAAACLFVGCRRDPECKTMLIDVSEAIEVNVFKLGAIYTTIVQKLGLKDERGPLYEVNPETLVQRFAHEMEFGSDEHRIAREAVQILKRMRRDWIHVGRRPAGVCGAALILAARMNNYRRTVREVVHLAKVADITINKRLDEFKYTESSRLTVDEFRHHGLELEKEHDPPAFYQQFVTKKKRGKRKIQDEEVEYAQEVTSISSSMTPESTVSPRSTVEPGSPQSEQLSARAAADREAMPPPSLPIDPRLVGLPTPSPSGSSSTAPLSETVANYDSPPAKRRRGRPKGAKNKLLPEITDKAKEDEARIEEDLEAVLNDPEALAEAEKIHQESSRNCKGGITDTSEIGHRDSVPSQEDNATAVGNDQVNEEDATIEESMLSGSEDDEPLPTIEKSAPPRTYGEIIDDNEFDSDPEVRDCVLSPAERALKEKVWVTENGDWLRKLQARQIKKEFAERSGAAKPQKRPRRTGRMGDMTEYQVEHEDGTIGGPRNAVEAMTMMMEKRGMSRRINYDAIRILYGRSSRSTSVTSDGSTVSSRPPAPLSVLAPGPSKAGRGKKGSPKTTTAENHSVTSKATDLPGLSAADKEKMPVRVATPSEATSRVASASPTPVISKAVEKNPNDEYATERQELDDIAKEGRPSDNDDSDDAGMDDVSDNSDDFNSDVEDDCKRDMYRAMYGEGMEDEMSDYGEEV